MKTRKEGRGEGLCETPRPSNPPSVVSVGHHGLVLDYSGATWDVEVSVSGSGRAHTFVGLQERDLFPFTAGSFPLKGRGSTAKVPKMKILFLDRTRNRNLCLHVVPTLRMGYPTEIYVFTTGRYLVWGRTLSTGPV